MSTICEPTVEEVRTIISTDLTDLQIAAIIDDAVLLVQRCITDLPCDLQAAIIKWATAHLIASLSTGTSGATGMVTQESLGDASISYAKPTFEAVGLYATTYGQQAIALDPNGCLTRLGRRRVRVDILGRDPNTGQPGV